MILKNKKYYFNIFYVKNILKIKHYYIYKYFFNCQP